MWAAVQNLSAGCTSQVWWRQKKNRESRLLIRVNNVVMWLWSRAGPRGGPPSVSACDVDFCNQQSDE